MKLGTMLEVDETFTTIWLSRSSEVRVTVRRWLQSPIGTIFHVNLRQPSSQQQDLSCWCRSLMSHECQCYAAVDGIRQRLMSHRTSSDQPRPYHHPMMISWSRPIARYTTAARWLVARCMVTVLRSSAHGQVQTFVTKRDTWTRPSASSVYRDCSTVNIPY